MQEASKEMKECAYKKKKTSFFIRSSCEEKKAAIEESGRIRRNGCTCKENKMPIQMVFQKGPYQREPWSIYITD